MKRSADGFWMGPVLFPVLIILALIFVFTSGVLGFTMGSAAAGKSAGKLIDTIVLSPVSMESGVDEITHFLSGQVRMNSGEVFANAVVKLDDKAQKQADENGKFLFADIRSGIHHLRVLDGEKVLASMTLIMDFSEDGIVHADVSIPDEPELTIPNHVRMVELTLYVEEDKIKLDDKSSGMITADGDIITFESKKLPLQKDSYAVTSNGNVVAYSGHILMPSDGRVISPSGVIERQSDSFVGVPGLVIEPKTGNTQTENGIVIEQDGSVRNKEDILISPGPGMILITNETVEEIIAPTEEYNPPQSEEEEKDVDEPESSSEIISEGESGVLPPDESSEPGVSSEPEDDRLEFISADTGMTWKQQSVIDLFKNQRNKVYETKKKSDMPVIAPGSEGYYIFNLKNTNDFDIEYDIMISEDSFHLPMYFSLYNDRNNKLFSFREKMQPEDGVLTPRVMIPANSEESFRIEWKWEYEDRYNAAIDNAYDTKAAKEVGPYIIGLVIRAEQKIKPVHEGEDDTRYPGEKPAYK